MLYLLLRLAASDCCPLFQCLKEKKGSATRWWCNTTALSQIVLLFFLHSEMLMPGKRLIVVLTHSERTTSIWLICHAGHRGMHGILATTLSVIANILMHYAWKQGRSNMWSHHTLRCWTEIQMLIHFCSLQMLRDVRDVSWLDTTF